MSCTCIYCVVLFWYWFLSWFYISFLFYFHFIDFIIFINSKQYNAHCALTLREKVNKTNTSMYNHLGNFLDWASITTTITTTIGKRWNTPLFRSLFTELNVIWQCFAYNSTALFYSLSRSISFIFWFCSQSSWMDDQWKW